MRNKARPRPLRVVVANGRPAAVILGITQVRELLEKAEDAEDLKLWERLRKRPLQFRKLEEFMGEFPP